MERTIALIQKSHEGDEDARAKLVEENIGLIWCVVKRFLGRGVESEDLFQIGSIGLLKAIDKFDFSFGVKFSTYAVPMISGEIQRFLRDDSMLKVSRSLKETAYKAFQIKEKMMEELNREPTLEELAQQMGLAREDLVMALEAGAEVESLYKPILQKDGKETALLEKIEEKTSQEEQTINRILLNQLLEELTGKERQVIYMRYYAEKSQVEIGKMLGISQVQVSRMEKRILSRMREKVWQ